MAANAIDIKRRLSEMQNQRSTWESHCQEIIDYMLPFRQRIAVSEATGLAQGGKQMTKILDSAATHALLLFAAGMSSRMANASIPWFKIRPEQEELEDNRNVALWLEQLEKIYNNVFSKSNFYTADQESYIDDGAFGMSAMYLGEHPRWKVYFESLNVGEVFVAVNEYGQIDTTYRKFQLSARNIVQRWGRDKVSDKIGKYVDGNKPDTMCMLIHAVEPRKGRDTKKKDKTNMAYQSVYLEYDDNNILQEGGYKEFPFVISRYFVASGEVYGRGPGMIALPDVKELQQKKSDVLLAAERKLFPPMLLPNDSFMGAPIKLTRNGINFTNSDGSMQDKIGVFPVPNDLMHAEQDIEQIRQRIGRIFFNDLMILAQDKEVTATEFIQVAQEKMQMLGPFLGRLQTERYNPIFDRVFNILWDQGEIPQPPDELLQSGGMLKIDYISPLAKAQRASESQGITQTAGFVGQVIQVSPETVDVIDWQEAVRHVAENAGMPQKLIRTPDEVAAIQQQKAQAAAEQQQMAMMLEAAKTMPALSKGPEPGSPMDQLNQGFQEGAGNAGQ